MVWGILILWDLMWTQIMQLVTSFVAKSHKWQILLFLFIKVLVKTGENTYLPAVTVHNNQWMKQGTPLSQRTLSRSGSVTAAESQTRLLCKTGCSHHRPYNSWAVTIVFGCTSKRLPLNFGMFVLISVINWQLTHYTFLFHKLEEGKLQRVSFLLSAQRQASQTTRTI